MPLGLTLGIAPAALAGMFPAVNGYFFIPTYGTLIAAVNFDRSYLWESDPGGDIRVEVVVYEPQAYEQGVTLSRWIRRDADAG